MNRTLLSVCLLLAPAWAYGVCAPEPVLKVVTSARYQGVPLDHFASKPKTLYRKGEKYGRVEEQHNAETGLHMLIVVNEPDVWIVNRVDSSGQHIVDSGPTYRFVAPVVAEVESKHWQRFEFGCEVAFMEEVKAERLQLRPGGPIQYRHSHEGISVELYVTAAGVPIRAEIASSDQRFSVEYESFEFLEAVPDDFFAKPEGVTFTEGG